jgi:hypothetical protein
MLIDDIHTEDRLGSDSPEGRGDNCPSDGAPESEEINHLERLSTIDVG